LSRGNWFGLVIGLQVALLLGWAIANEINLASAPTVVLDTAPVDPRDLLRGDFMILNYKISRVPEPLGRPADESVKQAGSDLWVVLQQRGRFHEVAATSWTPPADLAREQVVVRGRTRGSEGSGWLRVDYDIEKYFVPEGKGTPRFSEMVVEATVSRQKLGIKRLLVDGRPYP
jgi:uncharacterized membrane-anchored protein